LEGRSDVRLPGAAARKVGRPRYEENFGRPSSCVDERSFKEMEELAVVWGVEAGDDVGRGARVGAQRSRSQG